MPQFFKKDARKKIPSSFFNRKETEALFLESIFNSYQDAYEHLRVNQGLLYIHFNKTRELKTKVHLIDQRGKLDVLDLDGIEFVVQKHAQKIYDALNGWVEEGNLDQAKWGIIPF